MAKFIAFTAADTVGSKTETVPAYYSEPYGTDGEYILTAAGGYALAGRDSANVVHISKFSDGTFPLGSDPLEWVWSADNGDSYSYGTLQSLQATETTKTESVHQFLFAFDDKIKGSDFDDMLCGWDGKDKMWGFDGADQFYYGKGMGKDEICDFDKKKDEIVLDDSAATKFKKIAKKAKYNEKKEFTQLSFGDGDKLKIYGIDTKKELKKALAFDDFTDFA